MEREKDKFISALVVNYDISEENYEVRKVANQILIAIKVCRDGCCELVRAKIDNELNELKDLLKIIPFKFKNSQQSSASIPP